MSRLERLSAKPIDYIIGGETLTIYPLTIKELPLMIKAGKEDPESFKEIIRLTLKKAVPDATDEEINNISATHLNALSEAIAEINNLPKPKTE